MADKNKIDEKIDSLIEQKKVAFYSNLINGWIQTRLEKDKSILTISIAAIGFIITILTASNSINLSILMILCFALIAFMISTILVLIIFGKNSDTIVDVLEEKEEGKTLGFLDKTAMFSLAIGIILTVVSGISIGVENYFNHRITDMIEKKDSSNQSEEFNKSLNKISTLKPSNDQKQNTDSVKTKDNKK